MNFFRTPTSLVPFVLLCLANPGSAQSSGNQEESAGPLVLALSELVLERYSVQNVDANELVQVAMAMIGRGFQIKENGVGSRAITSMRLLNNMIVLYDTKEQVQRAVELLTRLDVPREGNKKPRMKFEYRPRFVSLKTVDDAVDDLVGTSLLFERGLIVLDGAKEAIDNARAVLEGIDKPERQVLLTLQLLEVDGPPGAQAMPKELQDNLQKLLPDSRFGQVGLALLKTSVSTQRTISVEIETPGKRYRFSCVPVAFDESSGSLTVTDCSLTEEVTGVTPRELFRTNTVLRGGEYTALAATGSKPRLLVVRVTPQG